MGALLRIIDLGRNSMWCDELYTVWVSRLPTDSYFSALSSWGHPPMYYLLGRVWFEFSTSDAWSRSISYIAGVAVILLVYLVGKELFSRQVGLWGALLASLSPILVSYSRDATYYSWLTSVSFLAFYLLTRSIIKGGWLSWVLFTVVALIAISSHLFSFLLLPAFAGVYLILRGIDRKSLVPFLVSHLTLAVAFVFLWLISHKANELINYKFPLKILLAKIVMIPYVLLGGGFNDFGAGIAGPVFNFALFGRRYAFITFFLLLEFLLLGEFNSEVQQLTG